MNRIKELIKQTFKRKPSALTDYPLESRLVCSAIGAFNRR